jgi:hypothetical protein
MIVVAGHWYRFDRLFSIIELKLRRYETLLLLPLLLVRNAGPTSPHLIASHVQESHGERERDFHAYAGLNMRMSLPAAL